MKKLFFFFLAAFSLVSADAIAGKRYWIAGTATYWNNTANWSASSGGAGGASVPGSTDTAYFDGNGVGNDTLDANVNVKWLNVGAGYTGTIVQRTYTLTMGTSGGAFGGGTFSGGSASITSSGNVTISATAFTSTSGTFSISKDFTVNGTGSFTHNSGKMKFTSTLTITGSVTLSDVEFAPTATATVTIASGTTLTVNDTMTISGSNACALNTGDIHAKKDVVVSNTGVGSGGTATLTFNGTASQYFTGSGAGNAGRLPNVVINKTSGTLYLQNHMVVSGNYTKTAGDSDPGTSTVNMSGSKTIAGTDTFYNLNFGGGTYAISNTLNALGTLTIGGSSSCILGGGTINANGNISITNTATGGGGDATVYINGTGSQTLTGSGTAAVGKLPHVTIDKSSGTLTLASIISCEGHWIFSGGTSATVDPGTSTVLLYGTYNLDGYTTSAMQFYRLQVVTGTRTLTGNVDANENFVINASATCVGGSYTINVGANWNSAGTWTYGTSTVVFDGNGYDAIRGASGANVQFANLVITRRTSLGSLPKNLRLLNPVLVNSSLTFNIGRIKSDSTNYLHFADNATCTVTNDDSAYVHGPVRKTGNDAFTFPLGDTTLHDSIAFHPLAITAPGNASDRFEARYYALGQTVGDSLVDSLYNLSTCENWTLKRQVGTSDVIVTLSWNGNSCNTEVYGNLRVANWNGSLWSDLGASAIYVNGRSGTIVSTGVPTYVSSTAYLTTASAKNNFPYAILKKKLDGGYYKATNGRLFFRFDEEYYESGDLRFNIYNDQHQVVSSSSLMPASIRPQVVYGSNYYHLNTVGCYITPSGALANGFYVLEVINDKNEKWYLRFEQSSNIVFSPCPPPSNPQ